MTMSRPHFATRGPLMVEDLELIELQLLATRPAYGFADTYEIPHGRHGRNMTRDLMLYEQCAMGSENREDWGL